MIARGTQYKGAFQAAPAALDEKTKLTAATTQPSGAGTFTAAGVSMAGKYPVIPPPPKEGEEPVEAAVDADGNPLPHKFTLDARALLVT